MIGAVASLFITGTSAEIPAGQIAIAKTATAFSVPRPAAMGAPRPAAMGAPRPVGVVPSPAAGVQVSTEGNGAK